MYIRLSLWKLVVLQTPKVPLAFFGYSSMAELGESTMASDLTFELRHWKCLYDSLRRLRANLNFLPKHQWLFLWSGRVRNIKKMKPLEAQVANSLLQKLPIVWPPQQLRTDDFKPGPKPQRVQKTRCNTGHSKSTSVQMLRHIDIDGREVRP